MPGTVLCLALSHPPGLPPQEQKAPKKKKEIPKELHQEPAVLRVLGSDLVALEPLLAGESQVSTVCNYGVIRTAESDKMTLTRVPWGPNHVPLPLLPPLQECLPGREGGKDGGGTLPWE